MRACVCARARVFVCVRVRVFVCTPHHDAPTGRLDDRLLRGSRVGGVATCVCLRAYAHARVLFACVCVCLYVRHTTTRRLAASIIICYGAPVLEVWQRVCARTCVYVWQRVVCLYMAVFARARV